MEAVETNRPDVLLIDVSLPLASGFVVAEKVHRNNPDVKVVIVSAHRDPNYVERALEVGAKGYVLKSSMRTDLLPAIREVMRGGIYRSALLA